MSDMLERIFLTLRKHHRIVIHKDILFDYFFGNDEHIYISMYHEIICAPKRILYVVLFVLLIQSFIIRLTRYLIVLMVHLNSINIIKCI